MIKSVSNGAPKEGEKKDQLFDSFPESKQEMER
jgi:hypothetical protein